MTESSGPISYALATAHRDLIAALDVGIRQYKANRRYSHSHHACRHIERFVDALREIPGGQEELLRRATLVETRCGPGSDYATTRAQSLASYRGQLHNLTGAKLAIARLRKSNGAPLFLADVAVERRQIERVLNETIPNLSATARTAYASWRIACRAVQREAEPLEVDGCWHLFHIHEAGEGRPSDRAELAKVIAQTNMGGANLESIKAATESMMAWAREIVLSPSLMDRLIRRRHEAPTKSTGWMGDVELAVSLGVQTSRIAAFRAKLRRMRERRELSMNEWQEVENRRRHEPQFLYRANAPAIGAMAKRYSLPK